MEKLIQDELAIRKEIINNFDKNYLLEAGAGAGKTTIIVERIITHIIDGSIDPRNIVAITFTKAASLELAERIQWKALEYLSKEEYSYAKDRLERVEEIFTGTIHSFCELLLREMPFEAGLTPGYEIVEDSEKFYEKIWYEFLRELEDEYREDIIKLNQFNIDYRELKQSAFVAMDNPDIDFIGFKNAADYKKIEDKFNAIDTNGLNASFIKKGSNLGKMFINIIEDKKNLEEYIDEMLMECAKVGENEDLAEKYIYKKHLKSDGVDEVVDFLEIIMSIYKDINAIIYNIYTRFINRVVKYRNEVYTNSLTFNDLLFRSLNLIKNSEKARKHFKNKFQSFYIDEAQDTDPMQAELLLLLSHEGNIENLKSLEDISPRKGSLFIVGDPKQSIYRFRRADITIYEAVKKTIASYGDVVYLDINFRSSDSICNWVEKTFKDRDSGFAFSGKPTLVQAGFEKILSLWKSKKQTSDDVNKFSGIYGYDFSEDIEIKEEEYIAILVEDMIKNGFIDEKIGIDEIKTRKIKNKDIMILTKSNEETGIYLNELKKRNIPSLLGGEKKLVDTREVLNLSLLIDFLVDWKDDIKLTAMLRNSFYLELETINYFLGTIKNNKEQSMEGILFDREEIKKLLHPQIKEVFLYLQEIFISSKKLNPITFVEVLIKNKRGIYDINKDYNEVEKRDADSALIQTLEILKSKNPISLYDIREELNEIIDKKVNYELPLDFEFSQNAVRIMNIHKAKGLEANIVILVGSGKRRTSSSDSHYIEKKGNITEGYMVYKKRLLVQCPDEQMRKDREREFKEAEIDRLIYVAATRSKTVLIMPSVEDEKLFLNPISREFSDTIIIDNIKDVKKDKIFSKNKLQEIKTTEFLIKKDRVSKPSYKKINPSDMDKHTEASGETKSSQDKVTPRGTIYGTMVHRAFEIVLKDNLTLKNIGKEDMSYAIHTAIEESFKEINLDSKKLKELYPKHDFNLEITENIDVVKDEIILYLYKDISHVIESFLKDVDIVDIFLNAKTIFLEFPFTYTTNNMVLNKNYGGQKQIVNGVIDLLVQKKDGNLIIIDYKTDIVSEQSFEEIFKTRYIKQLKTYKKVLEDILRKENIIVDELLIYSTYLKKIISMEDMD